MIPCEPRIRARRRGRRSGRRLVAGAVVLLAGLALASGCARYNTFYNAERAFEDAEEVREDKLRAGEDVTQPDATQRQNYQTAIKKAQKVLDNYPGHGLTDDALFLQGKSYNRIGSYRMSIRKLSLLYTNFPQTPFLEETYYLQAVNYLMLGDAGRSQDYLDRLARQFPESRFQSEALRASGDNAFALEDWEDAAAAYQEFLDRFPQADDWDVSTLRLGESLFELGRYQEAAASLQRVIEESEQSDRVFEARLLQARSLARAGEHQRAEELLGTLADEASIYQSAGLVAVAEAENLLAQDDLGAAITLLEGVPEEELSREAKPQRADLLGRAYVARGDLEVEDLEQARDYLQQAVGGARELEDPDDTRLLLATIKDYLAAATQLPDARPERAASLQLLQANALLFGFERPERALALYSSVAADTAADSTTAARALYGAMLVQDAFLDRPDSARTYAEALQERFPASPQAYEVRSGADANLLAFLLEREEELARRRRAEADTVMVGDVAEETPEAAGIGPLRRRMVYLQRRENLVYPPPAAAVAAQERRLAAEREEAAAAAAAAAPLPGEAPAETLSFDAPAPGPAAGPGGAAVRDTTAGRDTTATADVPADSVAAAGGALAPADTLRPAAADTAAAIAPADTQATAAPADTAAAEAEEDPEEEKPRSWEF